MGYPPNKRGPDNLPRWTQYPVQLSPNLVLIRRALIGAISIWSIVGPIPWVVSAIGGVARMLAAIRGVDRSIGGEVAEPVDN